MIKNSWRSYSPFLVLVPRQPNISLFVLGAALMFFGAGRGGAACFPRGAGPHGAGRPSLVGGTPFLVLNEYFYQPSFKLLEELVLDDLKRKYTGEKVKKYEGIAEEQLAISWYRQQLQDDPTAEIG